MYSKPKAAAALISAAGLALALTACGSDEPAEDTGNDDAQSTEDATDGDDMAAQPFGAACSEVPETGDGSFDGMATEPVATAASNNPLLETLVTAVGEAELGDTLNNAENITVFAPTNDAFAEIPEEDLTAVLEDKDLLTSILTYHVVDQTVTPDQLGTAGPFTTLQGADLEATGSGEDFTVGEQEATVLCGNVQTANATVYIIDTVLMPPAE